MRLDDVFAVIRRGQIWIPALLIAVLYIFILSLFMSAELVHEAFVGGFSLFEKLSILWVAFISMWNLMTPVSDTAIVLLALLTGMTMRLTFLRVQRVRSLKKRHIIATSGAVLGMIGSGCAACSLPVLSLLGLAGGVAFLPFGGEEILWIALVLQIVSFYYLLKTELAEGVCVVE